jgi:hypothetical protein
MALQQRAVQGAFRDQLRGTDQNDSRRVIAFRHRFRELSIVVVDQAPITRDVSIVMGAWFRLMG